MQETLAACCRPATRTNDSQRSYRVLSRSQRTRTGRNESTDYSGECPLVAVIRQNPTPTPVATPRTSIQLQQQSQSHRRHTAATVLQHACIDPNPNTPPIFPMPMLLVHVMTAVTGITGSSLRDEILYSTSAQKSTCIVDTMTPQQQPQAAVPQTAGFANNGANNQQLQRYIIAMPEAAVHRRQLPFAFGQGGAAATTLAAHNGTTAIAGVAITNNLAIDTNDADLPSYQFVEPSSVVQPLHAAAAVVAAPRRSSSSDSIRVALTSTVTASAIAIPQIRVTPRHRLVKRLRQLPHWHWRTRSLDPFSGHGGIKTNRTTYHSPPMEQHRLTAMGGRGATAGRSSSSKVCVEFEETLLEALRKPLPFSQQPVMENRRTTETPIEARSGTHEAHMVDGVACDELSAYMNELRQREKKS